MSTLKPIHVISLIAFVAMIVVNALANVLPINGMDTKEVSDLYPSLFTPAGITFSIWSVIYLFLLCFLVISWIRKSDPVINELLPWFSVSCVLNTSWILAWHYLQPAMSVVIMVALLVVLTKIFVQLHREGFMRLTDRIFIQLPFTLYLAWICVATIANISALLVAIDWNGAFLDEEGWTVVMMVVAALLAVKITLSYREPFFALVVMWALLGIHLRWRDREHISIFYASLMLITALVLVVLYSAGKKRNLV
jgi:benzodiazapine receptor